MGTFLGSWDECARAPDSVWETNRRRTRPQFLKQKYSSLLPGEKAVVQTTYKAGIPAWAQNGTSDTCFPLNFNQIRLCTHYNGP